MPAIFSIRSVLICALVAGVFFGAFAQTPALDSLLQHAAATNDPLEKMQLLNRAAFLFLDVDSDKTLEYGRQALDLAQKHENDLETARAYNNIATYYGYAGDYDQSTKHFEQSLEHYQKIDDKKGIADVLGNLGVLYYYKGNYAASLEYQFKALKIFEQAGNDVGRANTLSSVGSIYMEQGLFDKAMHYDTMAIQLYRKLDDQDGVALVLGNLGNIHRDQGDAQAAIARYLEAVKIYETLGNKTGQGRNLQNLAGVYQTEGRYGQAVQTSETALRLFREANFLQGIGHALGSIGTSYLLSHTHHGNPDKQKKILPGARTELLQKALHFLKQAVDIAQQTEDLNALSLFSRELAKACEADNDYRNAYRYFQMHTTARDSLHSIESKTTIEKLTTEREVELKNKQIELDRLAVEKKRNERLYFGIGIALLLLSVLFVYRNFANQKKANTQLAALNTRIAETNHELADKNTRLSQTLQDLNATQEQLIESEKQKENALIRSRISQDIHDDISSGLTKISWLAEAFLAKTAKAQAGVDIGPLEKINAYSKETVSKLGEIIWSSNPERDNLDSLLDYMRRYVRHYMEDAPMRWQVDFPEVVPDIALSPELRRNLYLVLKEALHNARKYSQATEIAVSFALDGHRYCLDVRDNGLGMQPGTVQGGGNGMANMHRRMEAIGGRMQVDTQPGKGVRMVFEGEVF